MSCYKDNALRMKSFWKKFEILVDNSEKTWYYISVLRKDIKILNNPKRDRALMKTPVLLNTKYFPVTARATQLNMEKSPERVPARPRLKKQTLTRVLHTQQLYHFSGKSVKG